MIDWKILAASFVALMLVSTVLVGGFGITNFLSDIIDKISEWLQTSPLGSIFSTTPEPATNEIDLTFFPTESYTLNLDSSCNVSFSDLLFQDFKGEIAINFQNKVLVLKQENSDLKINLPLEELKMHGLKLNKFELSGVKMLLKSAEWNITTENGSVSMQGFSGSGIIVKDSIRLQGNATKFVRN